MPVVRLVSRVEFGMHLKVESSKFAETLNLGMKQKIKHEDTVDLYLSNMVYGGAVQ